MSRIRSPIRWFGGKWHLAPRIVELLPPHQTYVEPFGGGASVLLAKPPSPVEVYNDLDEGLVNLFRVLREPDMARELRRRLELTPWSRREWEVSRQTWKDQGIDEVERAWRWYVAAYMSFSGHLGQSGFSAVVASSCRGMAKNCSQWISAVKNLPRVTERLRRVQVEGRDFREVIHAYDRPETLFYCDPPYHFAVRGRARYACELADSDHAGLTEMLINLSGRAVLSGYRVPKIHAPLESAGWKRVDFEVVCHAAKRTRPPRTESLWISPRVRKLA